MKKAFTLIELLVVITIIVVLLSLLTPALDQALYQTELAACGANLKTIASSVSTYAMGSKRYYPYRLMVFKKGNVQPGQLTYPDSSDALNNYDMRPMLSEFTGLDGYKCPLSGGFDVDTTDPNAFVYSNYNLFFGWQQRPGDGPEQPGMKKVGMKWGWKQFRYDVLAVDQDVISYAFGGGNAWSSHPDIDGVTSLEEMNGVDSAAFAVGGNPTGKYFTSKYGGNRGEIDLNTAFADNSVSRARLPLSSPYGQVGRSPHYNNTNLNGNNAVEDLRGDDPREPTNGTWNTIPLR